MNIKEIIMNIGKKKLAIIGIFLIIIIGALIITTMSSTPSGKIGITAAFGKLQEDN